MKKEASAPGFSLQSVGFVPC